MNLTKILRVISIAQIATNIIVELTILFLLITKGLGPHGIAGMFFIFAEVFLIAFLWMGINDIIDNKNYSNTRRIVSIVINLTITLAIWYYIIHLAIEYTKM